MNGETVAFAIIGLIILGSGLGTALAKRTFHAVMFLGALLVAVAALYILLGSSLIGIIQILVYVGGILTLFVFAVMFVAGDEEGETEAPARIVSQATKGLTYALLAVDAGLWATALGVVSLKPFSLHFGMAFLGFGAAILVVALLLNRASWATRSATSVALLVMGVLVAGVLSVATWQTEIPGGSAQANDLATLVDVLFAEQLLPFEILGVVLTAVMFGALVIARPMTTRGNEETSLVHPNTPSPPETATAPAGVVVSPDAPVTAEVQE